MNSMEINALALEYQRDYGTASRNLEISDLINNPAANGKCCVFGPGFEEELGHLVVLDSRPLLDDSPDSRVVRLDTI